MGTSPGIWARGRKGWLTPYLFIATIMLLMAAIAFYPTFYAIWLAATDANLLNLARAKYIGLQNFVRMANDPVFLNGLWRTVRWDLAVIGLEIGIALPIALFLDLGFRGRGLVRAAVLVPYIVPQAVVALAWVYMADGNFGVLNDLLVRVGVIDHYVPWLSDPAGSFWLVVGAMVWSGQPLMAIVLLAALQAVPKELYEAASIDGANAWDRFRHITLPHIMPAIFFLLLMRFIWMSNNVDMIFIMTGGGPGFSNYTSAVYSFLLINRFNIGYASATALALSLFLLIASAFYVRHLVRKVLA